MKIFEEKMVVGALEQCDLPELHISNLDVRVDTGAKTSSLHVDNIEEFKRDGERWVSFDIHPDSHNVSRVVRRSAKVKDQRTIKSSNAKKEKRCVIDTEICMGGRHWPIEVTLTDRSSMSYLMLLGREAMLGKLVVDPEGEYLLGQRAAMTGD
ncbi:MAG: ATP-dependent zinc protease [Oleiphilaceae bacterium]|nr:ATP-dependent zinc protease [Oleiphilaceae bacterium]